MEDFGMDSRMQTRECSGLHDRGKGVKTAERPIKAHSNGTLRHFHVLFRPFTRCIARYAPRSKARKAL